jgi:hypothetical protein
MDGVCGEGLHEEVSKRDNVPKKWNGLQLKIKMMEFVVAVFNSVRTAPTLAA